ncbi:Flagellar motor switch protein FliN [compost metagenome]
MESAAAAAPHAEPAPQAPVYQQPSQPMQQPPMQQPPMQDGYGYGQPAPYGYPPQGQPYGEPHHYGAAPGRNLNVQPVQFANLGNPSFGHVDENNLNLLMDIPLKVTVELGRTQRQIKDILELSQGSIIELDKLAGEPVDILVNNKLIAKGEVVVIDENFGVRVTDIVSQWDRIQKLQ